MSKDKASFAAIIQATKHFYIGILPFLFPNTRSLFTILDTVHVSFCHEFSIG